MDTQANSTIASSETLPATCTDCGEDFSFDPTGHPDDVNMDYVRCPSCSEVEDEKGCPAVPDQT